MNIRRLILSVLLGASLFSVALTACAPRITYPPLAKTTASVALYTMPEPLPTTEADVVLPLAAGEERRGLALCAPDYLQLQVRAAPPDDPALTGVLRVEYARAGQAFSRWYSATFYPEPDQAPDQAIYTMNTARLPYWYGVMDGVRVVMEGETAVTEVRLIRGEAASRCEPRLPLITSENDIVFDFSSEYVVSRNILAAEVSENGAFRLEIGTDPYIFNTSLNFRAEDFDQIVITLRAEESIQNRRLQVFYASQGEPFRQQQSFTLPLADDGDFHDYVIPTALLTGWEGRIGGLRLDPVPGGAGEVVEIRDFRVMHAPTPIAAQGEP
ncbi:MAG: hypothetical protein OHK0046_10070 [Anaerolineae bacterium]